MGYTPGLRISQNPGEIESRALKRTQKRLRAGEVELDSQENPGEIKSREVELDSQENPGEIKSREVELGSHS